MLSDVLKAWEAVEVPALEVYKDIFKLGEGYIQRSDEEPGKHKANPIGYWKNAADEKGHWRIFFEDTFEETLKELQEADFSLINGLTYFGRKRSQEHSSKMYAMIFDLDGVTNITLNSFLSGAYRAKVYPIPNYIILSGHGVHLYYVFEEPIPLFPNIKIQLKELKYALTNKIWNMYTSELEAKQYQGINQAFRVIGGKTKPGAAEPVTRAFRLHTTPFTLNQLNEYVPEEHRIDDKKLFRESKMSLETAKKKYPEWYEKVVLNKNREPKKWDIAGKVRGNNPYALYDWWLNKIRSGATYGHRYFTVMALAIYAVKCDVGWDRLWNDSMDLIPFLNDINPDHPFTKEDVYSALECFDSRYYRFPRSSIEAISGISVPANKRNGRKQDIHLTIARATRDILHPDGWHNKDGRPSGSGTAEQTVREWRLKNPEGAPKDCIQDTGLSKNTVYKWWK